MCLCLCLSCLCLFLSLSLSLQGVSHDSLGPRDRRLLSMKQATKNDSLSVSLCFFLRLCLSVCLSVCLSACLCLSLSLSFSFSVSVCLFVGLSLSLSLPSRCLTRPLGQRDCRRPMKRADAGSVIPVVVIIIFIVSFTAQQVFASDQKVGLALIVLQCHLPTQ